MTLRDEFETAYSDWAEGKKTKDDLFAWLEQKLAEREAETVERCYPLLCSMCKEGSPVEWQELHKRWIHRDVGCTVKCSASAIRALSPGPHYVERKVLGARRDEGNKWLANWNWGWASSRIADLDRQLAALPEPKK
jgi:hypothetical protein